MDCTKKTMVLQHCSEAQVNEVRDIIGMRDEGRHMKCPRCAMITQDIAFSTCNHVMCRDCFLYQIHNIEDGKLQCWYRSCFEQIAISDLREYVPATMIEKWLKGGVRDRNRKRPKLYGHCPTLDCQSVYLRKNKHKIWTCPTCLAQKCTECHSEQHFPQTCEEHAQDRILRELELQERERQLAMRETKPCPKWGVFIPKDDECNPVVCPGCRSQVC
jgi:hypothetical protein